MADVEIKARISVDSGNAATSIDNVNKSLKGVQDSTKGSTDHFNNLKSSLGSIPGPIGTVASGIDGLKKGFLALIANPVGLFLAAIVATLALLYKAFTNTFAGGQKVEQIFAGLKAAGQSLLDNLGKIGSAIKNVFTFNFIGAIKDIKDVGNAALEAGNKMAGLVKIQQGLKKEQLANDLDQAERAKKLAILREQATDETIPAAKRKAALLDLKKDAEQNSKDDIDLSKRTTENKIKQLTLQKDGALKNQEEINQLKINQVNVETDNANELRRIGKQITSADRAEKTQQNAAAKEAQDAAKAALKERIDEEKAAINERFKNEQLNFDQQRKIVNDDNILTVKDKKELLKEISNAERTAKNELHKELQSLEKTQKEKLRDIAAVTDQQKLDLQKTRALEEIEILRKKGADVTKLLIQNDLLFADAQAKLNESNAAKAKDERLLGIENELINSKTTFEEKRLLIAEQETILLADKLLTEEQKVKITEATKNKLADIAKQELADVKIVADGKKAIQDQTFGVVSQGIDFLQNIFGKSKAIQKAALIAESGVGIAKILINTQTANALAKASPINLLDPTYGIRTSILNRISAAIGIAGNIAATVKGLSALGGGAAPASGGNLGGGGGGVAAPLAPQTTNTQLNQASINGIGNAAAGGVNRAFVLDTDINNNAERAARLNRAARLG